MDELLVPYRAAAGPFPAPHDAPSLDSRFSPWKQAVVEHRHELPRDDFATLVGSWSWIANQEPEERDAVLARVSALADERVTLVYRTEVHVTRLTVE